MPGFCRCFLLHAGPLLAQLPSMRARNFVSWCHPLRCFVFSSTFALGRRERVAKTRGMNYRTKAEYFIRGITEGFVEASEVIAWSDEVVVTAAKPEDWMLEISSCGPDDRMVVLSHLNTIKGVADPVELAALLKAKGVS
jgi:hypothetical protein